MGNFNHFGKLKKKLKNDNFSKIIDTSKSKLTDGSEPFRSIEVNSGTAVASWKPAGMASRWKNHNTRKRVATRSTQKTQKMKKIFRIYLVYGIAVAVAADRNEVLSMIKKDEWLEGSCFSSLSGEIWEDEMIMENIEEIPGYQVQGKSEIIANYQE